jgi:NAD(P)-dependent dehydrogenase (short-subunit alcohol dehydrogenase family)
MEPPKKRHSRKNLHRVPIHKHPKLPNDIDLSGKVAIVTGARTGLGFYACLQFLSFRLLHLIIAVRLFKKGDDAASKLRAQFPAARIELWELEMSSYQSIQAFVQRA